MFNITQYLVDKLRERLQDLGVEVHEVQIRARMVPEVLRTRTMRFVFSSGKDVWLAVGDGYCLDRFSIEIKNLVLVYPRIHREVYIQYSLRQPPIYESDTEGFDIVYWLTNGFNKICLLCVNLLLRLVFIPIESYVDTNSDVENEVVKTVLNNVVEEVVQLLTKPLDEVIKRFQIREITSVVLASITELFRSDVKANPIEIPIVMFGDGDIQLGVLGIYVKPVKELSKIKSLEEIFESRVEKLIENYISILNQVLDNFKYLIQVAISENIGIPPIYSTVPMLTKFEGNKLYVYVKDVYSPTEVIHYEDVVHVPENVLKERGLMFDVCVEYEFINNKGELTLTNVRLLDKNCVSPVATPHSDANGRVCLGTVSNRVIGVKVSGGRTINGVIEEVHRYVKEAILQRADLGSCYENSVTKKLLELYTEFKEKGKAMHKPVWTF